MRYENGSLIAGANSRLNFKAEIGKTISLLNSRLETERTLKATYQSQKQYLLRQMFI